MEAVAGSSTAVYTGTFGMDYMLQLNRDPENPPTYAALGFGLSMLANRLSWFFDLRGPSIGLDSACSSTAMAIDIACQALRSGSCSMVSPFSASSSRSGSALTNSGHGGRLQPGVLPRVVCLDVQYQFFISGFSVPFV